MSSMTGDGMDEFFAAVEEARVEYEESVPFRSLLLAAHSDHSSSPGPTSQS